MAAQQFRMSRGRRILFPQFTGRRLSANGRFSRGRGRRILNATVQRFDSGTRAVNVTNTVRPALPVSEVITGTEALGLVEVTLGGGAFAVPIDQALNPLDPRAFPRLSALSSQFQNYVVQEAVLRYMPSVSQATDGTIMMAAVPDVDAPTPTSSSFFEQCGGGVIDSVFGKILTLPITKLMQNTAYNKLTLAKPLTTGDTDPINAFGRLFVGYEGVPHEPTDDPLVVGRIFLDYRVRLMNPKVDPLSNTLESVHHATPGGSADGFVVLPDETDHRITGATCWKNTSWPTVLQFTARSRRRVVIRLTSSGVGTSGAIRGVVGKTADEVLATGTELTPDWSLVNGQTGVYQFTVPYTWPYMGFNYTLDPAVTVSVDLSVYQCHDR